MCVSPCGGYAGAFIVVGLGGVSSWYTAGESGVWGVWYCLIAASWEGWGKMLVMASKFHFFTDVDLLSAQASGDEFGYITQANGKDTFQVTSLHKASSDPNVYAVCNGTVFIQDVANSGGNLVNLILSPIQQPPFAFPKIKFFIYRGIKKSSLINGNNIAPSITNDLTKSLWESQTAKNSSANTNEDPPKEALGIDLTANVSGFADTDPIDNAFYRTEVNFQLPLVKTGWTIGKFDKNNFGFEIMLESIGFNPSLGMVRNAANNNVNTINVATLGASPTQPQFFEHWHDKEEILNYVDPCAFFGSFYHNKLKVTFSNGNTDIKKGNEIYDDILVGAQFINNLNSSVFYNKNKIYFDIRNEYNFSINYFKNYGVSLTDVQTDIIIYDENNPSSTKNYYASGWPMMVFEGSDFNTGNTSKKNTIKIALPNNNGENTLPTIFLSVGTLKTDFPRETKEKNKLIDVSAANNFTDEIAIAVPNRNNQSSTAPISFYIRLKYLKRLDENPAVSSNTVIRAQNYLDNLFVPFEMRIPFGGLANVKSVVYDNDSFVDATSVISSDFIAKVGVADDTKNLIYFLFPGILRKEGSTIKAPFGLSGETNNTHFDFLNVISSKMNNIRVRKSFFKLSLSNVNYIDLLEKEDTSFDFFQPRTDGLIFVGLKKTDINIINIPSLESKYRIYLAFINEKSSSDEIGQQYICYDIALRGYAINSGQLEFMEVPTTKRVYLHKTN